MDKEDTNFKDPNYNEKLVDNNKKNQCPTCNVPLVYDHYMDSMKCLLCGYKYHISQEHHIDEENQGKQGYAHDDYCDYGDYVEDW